MIRFCFLFLLLILPQPVLAGTGLQTGQAGELDLKPGISQPYEVKKGDTLWDIANHFFKDPWKWMKIWERNLYITNPDLIYPGKKIWFAAEQRDHGGLTTVHPTPSITVKPVERIESAIDPALLMTVLERHAFIQKNEFEGAGYIVDSKDQRLNYGSNDEVYLKLNRPADIGDMFDIFRTAEPVRDPQSQDILGILVLHMGQVEITAKSGNLYLGRISKSFEEISRGDRLKPVQIINTRVVPTHPSNPLNGSILFIHNDANEAGQHQIVGINLGTGDLMQAGSILSVHKAGRHVLDVVTRDEIQLPEEKIGELMVLIPQKNASIAIIIKSTSSINIGDKVHSQAKK